MSRPEGGWGRKVTILIPAVVLGVDNTSESPGPELVVLHPAGFDGVASKRGWSVCTQIWDPPASQSTGGRARGLRSDRVLGAPGAGPQYPVFHPRWNESFVKVELVRTCMAAS